ncbi:hypothetical protein [Lacrimispora indolis]|uniref:hypothetical protein n=1 Tax=Lacrimispora indolis TaxID=69825 RepID=UPI00045E870D|nr:hypothetical protein [Lacrimispora indolis]
MKNRKNEFMKAMNQIIPEQFSKSSRRIVLFCEENSKGTVHAFLEAFREAAKQAVILQVGRKKEK